MIIQEAWRLTFAPWCRDWVRLWESLLAPGEEGARETKKCIKKGKKKWRRRGGIKRFTNLRAKWDGNGKRDREIGKGEGRGRKWVRGGEGLREEGEASRRTKWDQIFFGNLRVPAAGAGAISLKQGQTRMSLVPEPQVNLPQFHMINPDNCVLIASMVDGIQFSGPDS